MRVQTLTGPATISHELHVPLLQAGEVFGVLSLGRLADVPFAEADIVLVSHLADQSGVALSKAVVLRELRRRDTITRAVLDAAPNPIALLDDGGHPVVANEPMREVLPLLRERPVPDVADQVVRDEIEDGRSGRIFTRYVARLNEVEVGLHGRIVVLSDVTARREAERMKDEFSALVSHELRTPLTSIIGYLELLRDDADSDGDDPRARQRAQFLAVVDRNAKRLLRLVGDLLFVAQVEAGKLSLDETDVDLGAVARESVEAAAPRARDGGVELTLEEEATPVVRGDRDRLAQALDNLVSNAIKFTPAGGRVVRAARVRVRPRRPRGHRHGDRDLAGGPRAALPALLPHAARDERGDPGRRPRADDRPGDRARPRRPDLGPEPATARARPSASSCRCCAPRGAA